ncbi:MAG: hypothetical protein ABIU05_19935 [Nitrospirales bacterium]
MGKDQVYTIGRQEGLLKTFPDNSLFLPMHEVRGNHRKAHGMGLSVEHVGEHPTVLTIFPVDFPDTGNLVAETSWLLTGSSAKQSGPARHILCFS